MDCVWNKAPYNFVSNMCDESRKVSKKCKLQNGDEVKKCFDEDTFLERNTNDKENDGHSSFSKIPRKNKILKTKRRNEIQNRNQCLLDNNNENVPQNEIVPEGSVDTNFQEDSTGVKLKRKCSFGVKSAKRLCVDNENSESLNPVSQILNFDPNSPNYKFMYHYPNHLISLMYQLELSILCLLRKSTLKSKYSSSLKFGNSNISDLNDIEIQNSEKAICIKIEHVDKYYSENGVNYNKLFSKRYNKGNFCLNNYLYNFVKSIDKFSNHYIIVYTNSGLDIGEGNKLNQTRSLNFYPFEFVNFEKDPVLSKFFFDQNHFYQFSKDETTLAEFSKRLVYPKDAKIKSVSQFSEQEVKKLFLDKLIFAVNQPTREEISSIIRKEMKERNIRQKNYTKLKETVLTQLISADKSQNRKAENVSQIVYNFNLFLFFVHKMFLDKRIFSVNFEEKKTNSVRINYKNKEIYITALEADTNIYFGNFFSDCRTKEQNLFALNKYFSLFAQEARDANYFVIYTNAGFELTENLVLKGRKDKGFRCLKVKKMERKSVFKHCLKGNLYQFEEASREKIVDLLKLSERNLVFADENLIRDVQTDVEDICMKNDNFVEDNANFVKNNSVENNSVENNSVEDVTESKSSKETFVQKLSIELKNKFLDKLVFAVDQCNRKQMIQNLEAEIGPEVPYDCDQLNEVGLRWSESREYGPLSKEIVTKLVEDIKNCRSSHRGFETRGEINFAKRVSGSGTLVFDQFSRFLIQGEGSRYFAILKAHEIDLNGVADILVGSNSRVNGTFKDLCELWFDKEGNKTLWLDKLDKEGIPLESVFRILAGAKTRAVEAFKELYEVLIDTDKSWNKRNIKFTDMSIILEASGVNGAASFKKLCHLFDAGSRRLKEIGLNRIVGVLKGAGEKAPTVFEELYNLWFNDDGTKSSYLRIFEEQGVGVTNICDILLGAGANAARCFRSLCKLWFLPEGGKTSFLKHLENSSGIGLIDLCGILYQAGSHAPKICRDLYNFWRRGNQVQKLRIEGISLVTFARILRGSSTSVVSAFKELFTLLFDTYLTKFKQGRIPVNSVLVILGGSGNNFAGLTELYDLWFDGEGNKTRYLLVLEKEQISLETISRFLEGSGANAAKAFRDLYDLWYDKECLKNLRKLDTNLSNVSGILNSAGANAPKGLEDLCNLWFDPVKTQYLKILQEGHLTLFSRILNGAGASAARGFKKLYNLWFDQAGNKTRCLLIMEEEGITLEKISNVLYGAGAEAPKAFKEFYKTLFDAEGNRNIPLTHFIHQGFKLHGILDILNKSGAQVKDVFEELYHFCFDTDGRPSDFLENCYKAGFKPKDLSRALQGTGTRATIVLKKFHDLCFAKRQTNDSVVLNDPNVLNDTKNLNDSNFLNDSKVLNDSNVSNDSKVLNDSNVLDDFYRAGFRPKDLCRLLSGVLDHMENFHEFCFIGERKNYLSNFVNDREGFSVKDLVKVLQSSGFRINTSFSNFHDICYDWDGKRLRVLDDFLKADFTGKDLANIFSKSGTSVSIVFRKFHSLCFSNTNCLHHFLVEEELFTPSILAKILFQLGDCICPVFEKLHNFCFDAKGGKTKRLEKLINGGESLSERLRKKIEHWAVLEQNGDKSKTGVFGSSSGFGNGSKDGLRNVCHDAFRDVRDGLENGIQDGFRDGIQDGIQVGIEDVFEDDFQDGFQDNVRRMEERTKNLIGLLKVLPSLQDGVLSKPTRDKFLKKLLHAVNESQPNKFDRIIKTEIDKCKVLLTGKEVQEIVSRSSEFDKISPVSDEVIEKLIEDVKTDRFESNVRLRSIREEMKFSRNLCHKSGTSSFYQLLEFLVKGEGKKHLEVLKKQGISLSSLSTVLKGSCALSIKGFKDLYDLWFDKEGNKTHYLTNLEKEGIQLRRLTSIIHAAGTLAANAFKDLYDLLIDPKGSKSSYLKCLEQSEIQLNNVSTILCGAGTAAPKAFQDLYNLWFDDTGQEKQLLRTLRKNRIHISIMCIVLKDSGSKGAENFQKLYDLWFDAKGNKTRYLATFEENQINVSFIAKILSTAKNQAPKSFQDLYNLWFDPEGNKSRYLEVFVKEGIELSIVAGTLVRAGSQAAKTFQDLYDLWFDPEGNKTECLDTLTKSGINLNDVCKILNATGSQAADTFQKLYNLWFDESGLKTRYLETFEKNGIGLENLSNILSHTGTYGPKIFLDLYNLWFDPHGEKTVYLKVLYRENLFTFTRILFGVKCNYVRIFKDLFDIWFDQEGNKQQCLKDLEEIGISLPLLIEILRKTGINVRSTFSRFYEIWFDKEGKKSFHLKCLERAGIDLETMQRVMYMAQANAPQVFKNLCELWFDEEGNQTRYLTALENGVSLNQIAGILRGSGSNTAKAFKELFEVWFDEEGKKKPSLLILENEGIRFDRIANILNSASVNAAEVFQDLVNLWFDGDGNKNEFLELFEREGMTLGKLSVVLQHTGKNGPKVYQELCEFWFEGGNKSRFLMNLEKEGVDAKDVFEIVKRAGSHVVNVLRSLYNFWFDKKGKTKYLKTLEKEEVKLVTIVRTLRTNECKAAVTFRNLYDLCFDKEGKKTKFLASFAEQDINLNCLLNILLGAGNGVCKNFMELHDLFFDSKDKRSKYLKTFEKNGLSLVNLAIILSESGRNTPKAFLELDEALFNPKGEKTRRLETFMKSDFGFDELSGIFCKTGCKFKDGFEKFHDTCFDLEGEKTRFLKDFNDAGFRACDLACLLFGSGHLPHKRLKSLHRIFFVNVKRLLEHFFGIGFRVCDFCFLFSDTTGKFITKLYSFILNEETAKCLNDFLNDGLFTASHLAEILHGSKANVCAALADFHQVCFDQQGQKTDILMDFCEAGFSSNDLSSILAMTGSDASFVLVNFHAMCFKKNYLKDFLSVGRIFKPKKLTRILEALGRNLCIVFEKLHNVCFEDGEMSDYLNELLENDKKTIVNKLEKKVKKFSVKFSREIPIETGIINVYRNEIRASRTM